MHQETESVRINKELKCQLKDLSQRMRPRTAVQYLIEDAVEQYLKKTRTASPGKKRAECQLPK